MSVREKVADILRDGFTPGYERPADEVADAAIRAVLEAMREPSEGMLDAGYGAPEPRFGEPLDMENVWQAMLEQWAKEQGVGDGY